MVVGTGHALKTRVKKTASAKASRAKTQRLDRRSGTGRSRVESPKKGGCGGKTVWGRWVSTRRAGSLFFPFGCFSARAIPGAGWRDVPGVCVCVWRSGGSAASIEGGEGRRDLAKGAIVSCGGLGPWMALTNRSNKRFGQGELNLGVFAGWGAPGLGSRVAERALAASCFQVI
eukprot:evm.model.scf_1663.4 EVM.evm.TU.scf_1663.4   scf_1663:13430-14068(+)